MAQQSTVSNGDTIKQQLMKASELLKEDARKNSAHISYESFGTDKNKKRKNQRNCDRGTSTGPARYCSPHLRKIYKKNIIGDNEETEWCVRSRHSELCCANNPCHLCHIDTQHHTTTPTVNFAEAITCDLGGNTNKADPEKYQRRLLSFMLSHIGSNYPGTGAEYTKLRIKVNDDIWLEYYLKLTAFSSLLKTSAPSGYKYKDRISVGRMIRMQAKKNTDLVFYITKDDNYNDPEYEEQRPVVNGVGFWDLLKPPKAGDIRNIIHLNLDQAVHASFGFLINPNTIHSIEVDLVCTRHSLAMENTELPLWRYPVTAQENNVSIPVLPTPTVPVPENYNNFNKYALPFQVPPIPMTHYQPNNVQLQPMNNATTPPGNYTAAHGITNFTPVQFQRHSPYAYSMHPTIRTPFQPLFDEQSQSPHSISTNMFDHMFADNRSTISFNTDIVFRDNDSIMQLQGL